MALATVHLPGFEGELFSRALIALSFKSLRMAIGSFVLPAEPGGAGGKAAAMMPRRPTKAKILNRRILCDD